MINNLSEYIESYMHNYDIQQLENLLSLNKLIKNFFIAQVDLVLMSSKVDFFAWTYHCY